MKDLDLVKVVLILTVAVCVLLGGAHFWLNSRLGATERDLERAKDWLEAVGEYSAGIERLEEEKASDLMLSHQNQPFSYFQKMAEHAGMDANQDYKLSPRGPDVGEGYQDMTYTLTFYAGREKRRQNLAYFLYNVEAMSPRVKLVKADLRLDPKQAERDLWKATLTFLQRDPVSGDAGP